MLQGFLVTTDSPGWAPRPCPRSTCFSLPHPTLRRNDSELFITHSNDQDDFMVGWAGLPFVAQTQHCNVCRIPASFRVCGSAFAHLSSGKIKGKRNTTSSVSIAPTPHPQSRLAGLTNASYRALRATGMLLPARGNILLLLVSRVPFTGSECHTQGMQTAAFTHGALMRNLCTMTSF